MAEAPYPADTRAKGWRFELDYEQIEQSDTWALTPAEYRPWLLMLWLTAWKQVPAGSLPANDPLIAARIGMPMDQFVLARDVLLRGWREADDGRLYHETVSRRVLDMLAIKEKERARKAAYRAKQSQGSDADGAVKDDLSFGRPITVPRDTLVTDTGCDATGTGTGTGTGLSLPERPTHTPASPRVGGVAIEGTFEGHETAKPATPNPVAPMAIALTRAGFKVTTLNPNLIAYQQEGGTVDHLQQLAAMDEFQGKGSGYILAAALRELRAKPAEVQRRQTGPGMVVATVPKTAQGIAAGERLRRGVRHG